jgi:hypothetical protein
MKYLIKEDGPSVSGLGGFLRPHSDLRGSGTHPVGGVKTNGIRGFDLGDAISSPKGEFDYEDDEVKGDEEVEIDIVKINAKMPMDPALSATNSLAYQNSRNTMANYFPNAGNVPLNAGHQIQGDALLESYIRELLYENSVARGMNPMISGYSSFGFDSYKSNMQLRKGKNRMGGLGKQSYSPLASQGGMQHTYGRDKVRSGEEWGRARRKMNNKKAMPDNYEEVSDQWKKENGLGLTSYQLSQIANKDTDRQWVDDIKNREDEIKSKNKRHK